MIFNQVVAGFEPCTFGTGVRHLSHLSSPSVLRRTYEGLPQEGNGKNVAFVFTIVIKAFRSLLLLPLYCSCFQQQQLPQADIAMDDATDFLLPSLKSPILHSASSGDQTVKRNELCKCMWLLWHETPSSSEVAGLEKWVYLYWVESAFWCRLLAMVCSLQRTVLSPFLPSQMLRLQSGTTLSRSC